MKKLLALLVAFICVLAITFTACLDNTVDSGEESGKNEQLGGNEDDDDKGNNENDDKGGSDEENSDHECDYAPEWTPGVSTHWHASLCSKHPNNKSEEAPHEFTSLTGTCEVCDAPTPSTFFEGEKLPCFSFSTYANSSATFSTESAKGKALVINFWFTTCTPCIEEMPEFETVSQKYGDDIVVVALHADDDYAHAAASFINNKGWSDYKVTFGFDDGNIIYNKLGGNGSYPLTVVVNTEGIIVELIDGKVIRQEGLENPKIVDYINPAIQKALGR